jgi:spermidine synthase
MSEFRTVYQSGNIYVTESGNVRYLSYGGTPDQTYVVQVAVPLDNNCIVWNKLYDYTRVSLASIVSFSRCLLKGNDPDRILFFGLGGGLIPTMCKQMMPTTKTKIVEIDPLVSGVATEWFEYNPSDHELVIDDVKNFLDVEPTTNKNQVIYMDIGDSTNSPPKQFMTKNRSKQILSLLHKNGVFITNVYTQEFKELDEFIGLVDPYFRTIHWLGVGNGNYVVVAYNETRISRSKLINQIEDEQLKLVLAGGILDGQWKL